MLGLNLDLLRDSVIIGVMGALLGIFFRNCLKPRNMIFNFWYELLFKWVIKGIKDGGFYKPNFFQMFRGKVAYILGYCVYCTATWITFGLHILFLGFDEYLIFSSVVQHIIVVIICRFIIDGFKELKGYEK